MIVRDLYQELFAIVGFVETNTVFLRITEAMRSLQKQRDAHIDDARIDLILIQSWNDEIEIKDKRAVLYMMRAQELYRTDYTDEGAKYESLAIKYYLTQESKKEKGKPNAPK